MELVSPLRVIARCSAEYRGAERADTRAVFCSNACALAEAFHEEHPPRPSWYGLLHPLISTASKGNESEQGPTSGPAHVPYSASLTGQYKIIERGEGVTAGSGEDDLQL
jgi:hypothetical protein